MMAGSHLRDPYTGFFITDMDWEPPVMDDSIDALL